MGQSCPRTCPDCGGDFLPFSYKGLRAELGRVGFVCFNCEMAIVDADEVILLEIEKLSEERPLEAEIVAASEHYN